jgi:hypothetical protein
MAVVMYHVTDRANRESIGRHGLDWRRMGAVPGIAGSRAPEHRGVFLAEDLEVVKFFVEMGQSNERHEIDVWEVSLDLDVELSEEEPSPCTPLVRHADGFLCYLEPIPPERLRLIDPAAFRDH